MKYVYIGEIVNTHGIKGELRVVSEFPYKDKVFIHDMKIYLGKRKQEMTINTYRPHKIYDMITMNNINDINDAIAFKGDSVFINREDLDVDGYVKEDIIGMEVYNYEKFIGIVTNIIHNKAQNILIINSEEQTNMIPLVEEFVKNIDLINNRMDIETIEGLINEN